MIPPSKRYARKGEFELRIIDEEAVLVPVRGGPGEEGAIYAFNEVGAAIWRLIDPSRDAAEIGRLIAGEFDVSVEKATEDVCAFLALLATKDLLRDV